MADPTGIIKVLIVDDHQVVRQGLRTFLDLHDDIQVIGEAGDGARAVEMSTQLSPDVILMDLVMPGMDGMTATRGIKSICPNTRVIALTSFTEDDKIFPAIQAGASSYLLKDVSPEDLVEAIRAVHRGETRLHQLPLIDVAMSRGELSYSKVRALTRVATAATQDVLLNVALHGTTHHVETLVPQFRRVQVLEEQSREARQYAQRRLTYFHDADGSLVVRVQLPAESGALLLAALEAGLADVPLPNDFEGALHVSAETRVDSFAGAPPPMSARRADALLVLAESFLQHGAQAMSGGDRHQIVLHVDEFTLNHPKVCTFGL